MHTYVHRIHARTQSMYARKLKPSASVRPSFFFRCGSHVDDAYLELGQKKSCSLHSMNSRQSPLLFYVHLSSKGAGLASCVARLPPSPCAVCAGGLQMNPSDSQVEPPALSSILRLVSVLYPTHL